MGSGLLPAASFDVTALVSFSVLVVLVPVMAFLTVLKREGAMAFV